MYVRLTGFLRQQWFPQRASLLRSTYIACLTLLFFLFISVPFLLVYLPVFIDFLLLFPSFLYFSHSFLSFRRFLFHACYPQFLFLHSLHSFPLSFPYHLSTSLLWFKKLCSQCAGPPPLTDLWKSSVLLLPPSSPSVSVCDFFYGRIFSELGGLLRKSLKFETSPGYFAIMLCGGDNGSFLL